MRIYTLRTKCVYCRVRLAYGHTVRRELWTGPGKRLPVDEWGGGREKKGLGTNEPTKFIEKDYYMYARTRTTTAVEVVAG